jgi:hypothetical protein
MTWAVKIDYEAKLKEAEKKIAALEEAKAVLELQNKELYVENAKLSRRPRPFVLVSTKSGVTVPVESTEHIGDSIRVVISDPYQNTPNPADPYGSIRKPYIIGSPIKSPPYPISYPTWVPQTWPPGKIEGAGPPETYYTKESLELLKSAIVLHPIKKTPD